MTAFTVRELRYFCIAMSVIRSRIGPATNQYLVQGSSADYDCLKDDARFAFIDLIKSDSLSIPHFDDGIVDIENIDLESVYGYSDCVQVKLAMVPEYKSPRLHNQRVVFNVWLDRKMLGRLYEEVGLDGIDDEPQDEYKDWDFSQTETIRSGSKYDQEDEDRVIDITYPYVLLKDAGTPQERIITMINRHIDGIKELPSFGTQEHLVAIEKLTNFMDEM